METYSIVRRYEDGDKKILRQGLTLDEARAHCQRAETSSSTTPRRRDAVRWMDTYVLEPHRDFWGRVSSRKVGLLESALQEYCRIR